MWLLPHGLCVWYVPLNNALCIYREYICVCLCVMLDYCMKYIYITFVMLNYCIICAEYAREHVDHLPISVNIEAIFYFTISSEGNELFAFGEGDYGIAILVFSSPLSCSLSFLFVPPYYILHPASLSFILLLFDLTFDYCMLLCFHR